MLPENKRNLLFNIYLLFLRDFESQGFRPEILAGNFGRKFRPEGPEISAGNFGRKLRPEILSGNFGWKFPGGSGGLIFNHV